MREREPTSLELAFARVADGDRSAVPSAFEALVPIVRAFCARFVNEVDVDDAVQLSLEKIFARSHEFDAERPLLPWVCAVSAWECRTLRTKRRRMRENLTEEAMDRASEDRSPEETIAERELTSAAQIALGTLSETDQRVLREAFWGTAPKHDPAARKRKERALERIRHAMRRLYGV